MDNDCGSEPQATSLVSQHDDRGGTGTIGDKPGDNSSFCDGVEGGGAQQQSSPTQQQASISPPGEAEHQTEVPTPTNFLAVSRDSVPHDGISTSHGTAKDDNVAIGGSDKHRDGSAREDIAIVQKEPEASNSRPLGATGVIDFTRDDDDNIFVKLEPNDSEQNNMLISQAPMEGVSVADTHALPQIGYTEIPDDSHNMFVGEHDDLDNNLDAERMRATLEELDGNIVDSACSPAEIDSDDEDKQARRKFQTVKDNFQACERAGIATAADEIDFRRHETEETNRLQARKNRKQHEQDEAARATEESSLFVPENPRSASPRESDDEMFTTPANVSMLQPGQSVQKEVIADKPRRGRPAKADGPNSTKRKKAGNLGVSKTPPSASTARKRRQKNNQPAMFNTSNLFSHDIIAEARANQGLAEQPGFKSKKKKDALAELIASLPANERNLHIGDKVDLHKATLVFNGRGSMKADGDGNWRLKGMKSSLRNYQLLGVSWMRKRENEVSNPRGGILSDDMGLGKTVSAIANMVDGRPTSNQTTPRATLIVMPPALMNQWMSEFEKHVEPHIFRNVMIYRSKYKILDPVHTLGNCDIVVTSYHEIARSLPANSPPPSLCTPKARIEWWEKEVEEKKGPLHKINWHRIVLDESQAIKNYLSKTSEAVCRLTGKYRWCLSGTPIQNSLEEFYPYFRFLRCRHTGSFELFKQNFTKNGSQKAIQRLQIYLAKIMLRRTHVDKLFGRPILSLPPIEYETIEVSFNRIERSIYNIVRERFIKRINTLTTKDSPGNNYRHIFVLLLRLRQLVGNPMLIQRTLTELLELEDLQRLRQLTDHVVPFKSSTGDYCPDGDEETARVLENALHVSKNLRSARMPEVDENSRITYQRYLRTFTESEKYSKINERSLCSACGSPAFKPHITACLHLYCLACLNDHCFTDSPLEQGGVDCITCGIPLDRNKAIPISTTGLNGGRLSPEEDIEWYDMGGRILRSAKIKAAVNKIKEWFAQDGTNKILIFTQFRGMIRIMERVCREEKTWDYATYHGEMSFDSRDEAIQKFSTDPECRIMIAALRAGGTGLNLTAANRVIILDLWWNDSVESQAFTRCFRIGQDRDVKVARFVVRDSIDIKILHMQARKSEEIGKAMEEGKQPKSLTTPELLELFGDCETQQPIGGGRGEQIGIEEEHSMGTNPDVPFVLPNDPYGEYEDEDVEMIDSN